MPIVLKRAIKPLPLKETVRRVVKGVTPPPPPIKLKKRVVEIPTGRESQHWSLTKNGGGETYGLSVSSIEKWLDCREQFRLEKAGGLRSLNESAAIDNGELWHWMLGRLYAAQARDARDAAAGCRLWMAQFKRDNPNAPERRLEEMEMSCVRLQALWPVYLEKFADDDAAKDWVGIEHEWEYEHGLGPVSRENVECRQSLTDPKPTRTPLALFAPGCRVPLRGIFDGIFRKDGRLWLFETKTKSRIDEAEIEDTMHLDLQVGIYLYAIKRVFKEYPAGVQYNVIRNPMSEPSAKKQESVNDYRRRLEGDARKDEDHFFKRWELPVTDEEINSFVERQLEPILRDVQGWVAGTTPHYIHTKALTGKFGKAGMYDVITKGDTTGVRVRESTVVKKKER